MWNNCDDIRRQYIVWRLTAVRGYWFWRHLLHLIFMECKFPDFQSRRCKSFHARSYEWWNQRKSLISLDILAKFPPAAWTRTCGSLTDSQQIERTKDTMSILKERKTIYHREDTKSSSLNQTQVHSLEYFPGGMVCNCGEVGPGLNYRKSRNRWWWPDYITNNQTEARMLVLPNRYENSLSQLFCALDLRWNFFVITSCQTETSELRISLFRVLCSVLL